MAISKEKVLPNGTSGGYWKVIHISLDKISDPNIVNLNCLLSLFMDKEHAAIKADLGVDKSFTFKIAKKESIGDMWALSYIKIKEMQDPDLAGGEDV